MVEVQKLSGYTWISTAQYIQWLELYLGLEDVNVTSVWSMKVTGKRGFAGLLTSKVKIRETLCENLEKIRLYVAESNLTDDQEGMTVTFGCNIESAIDGVDGQIDTIGNILKWQQRSSELVYEEEINLDEPPF